MGKVKKNRGFVMLFAVTISSILLAMAIGVANIALKEVKFGASATDANKAFFAADTGAECALFHDKLVGSSFPIDGVGAATSITCGFDYIPVSFTGTATTGSYNFVIPGLLFTLGQGDTSCSKVNVFKDKSVSPILVVVTSKGYNIGDANCDSTNPNRVERELKISSAVGVLSSTTPLSSWTFNTNANDSVGTNNGILQNGASIDNVDYATGGGSLNVDGVNDYVDVGSPPEFNFGSGDFTYMAWIKTSVVGGGNRIIAQDRNLNQQRSLVYLAGNVASFRCRDSSGNMLNADGITPLNDGQWHHLAGVRNGSTGYIYVDGELDGSATNVATGSCDGDTYTTIGGRPQTSSLYFNGKIDQVKIYNVALGGTEIQAIYISE